MASGRPLAPAIPLIRAAPVRAAVDSLRARGTPVERLLERAGLSPAAVLEGHPEALVPLFAVAQFLEIAARSEGMDDLGLSLGAALDVSQLGVFGILLLTARTLGESLRRAFHYWSAFDSGERSWVVRNGDRLEVHYRYLHPEAETWEQGTGVALGLYLQHIAAAAGPAWYPTVVDLPIRRFAGVRSHPLLANARIRLGRPTMMIRVPAAVFHRALPGARGPAAGSLVDRWAENGPAGDVAGALGQVITACLPAGYPDIQRVAAAVGMSTRTLQRRLQEGGETYASVVAKARYGEARRLLRDPARKVIDVAFDLGYSDPAHFTRAFDRWAGMTPRDFRRRALGDAGLERPFPRLSRMC